MQKQTTRKWMNRPVRARTKMVSFRVSLDELRDLEVEALRRRVNLSDLMRLALDRLLNDRAGR